MPAPTGDNLRDLALADEHFARVDQAWDTLDFELRRARIAAGMFPTDVDQAELRELERRTATAWRSREVAQRHRDRLFRREGHLAEPGFGLPPGDRDWYGEAR